MQYTSFFVSLQQFFACLVILFACEVAAGIWGFMNKDKVGFYVKLTHTVYICLLIFVIFVIIVFFLSDLQRDNLFL